MIEISRRITLLMIASAPLPALAAPMPVTLYKNPQCDCCEGYADYLRQNGFTVDVKPTNDLATLSHRAGVPEELDGCHISMIDGYVVEGHVPIAAIRSYSPNDRRSRRSHCRACRRGLPAWRAASKRSSSSLPSQRTARPAST
jgi:hypothetical protein